RPSSSRSRRRFGPPRVPKRRYHIRERKPGLMGRPRRAGRSLSAEPPLRAGLRGSERRQPLRGRGEREDGVERCDAPAGADAELLELGGARVVDLEVLAVSAPEGEV